MAVAFKHRFTVDDYMRMGETGIIPHDLRVELIDGEIIKMPPINPPHQSVVNRLTKLLVTRLGDRAIVQIQGPVRLDNHSMPQPDILLLAPRADYYSKRHPDSQTVFLAIEVADTSLRYDREIKGPLYAQKGIREYWVVDVNARRVDVYREPHTEHYAIRFVAQEGTPAGIDAFPDESFDISEIFG